MKDFVFVTGNQKKAEYLSDLLELPVEHMKLDIPEIQSLDLETIVKHKLHLAYSIACRPVLVEDVSLEFVGLGKLPGTLIKWFMQELSFGELCNLLEGKNRTAIARCVFGYYDGQNEVYFEGYLNGMIADKPSGKKGFGWDSIFIPDGYTVTRAELSKEDDYKVYKMIKPISKVRDFLDS